MTATLTEQELTEIEHRLRDADEGFPRDKLTFYRHAYTDVPRLIAALREARRQAADPLRQAAPVLLAALQEAVAEIEYCHNDCLSEDERNHPRGSGWVRVWDRARAAIDRATAA